MVSIRDKAENDFVFERFRRSMGKIWLGGHPTCPGCDDWTWTDGSDFSFTNWDGGEPNGPPFNAPLEPQCLEMGYFASRPDKWNDWGCHHTNRVVCERRKV